MKKSIILLCTVLITICGYSQKKYGAIPSDFEPYYVLVGKTVKTLKVPITITNTGTATFKSISYIISYNGVDEPQRSKTFNAIAPGESGQVEILFKADSVAKKCNCTFTITKMNGKANEEEDPCSYGSIITITEKPVVVPVVEEFTGTWCGWCPIGFDGVENAHATFGDKAALIAIHCGDVMECSDFSALNGRVSGYPSAVIDLIQGDFYPTTGGVKDKINQQIQNKIAAASIKVSAEWTTATKRYINITTKTKFAYSDDNANYAIGYALTEDGMHGTGSDWAQNNNLSGNSSYASSNPFWYNASKKVSNVKFNHVGVAAWGIEKGINGSVPTSVVAGEEQEYTYKANISTNNLIQNKSNLKVIVMLIDRSTGTIVNAAQAPIDAYNTTALDEVESRPTLAPSRNGGEVYDLSGRRVDSNFKNHNSKLGKGLYIVNGKKVLR